MISSLAEMIHADRVPSAAHRFFIRDFFAGCKEVSACDTVEIKPMRAAFVQKLTAES
jgi:hypothetical protein